MGMPPAKADSNYPGMPSTSTDLDPSDSLITLGKARISPINMANTYATIANGGQRADVHVINKVTDQNGTVLYQFHNQTQKAIPQDVSDDVSYALQQVVKGGTGKAALALGRPAAGKTGTATNNLGQVDSAWFVGYTPQEATAVMYIRGKGSGQLDGWLPSYFGADYPARTWTAVMKADMEGLPIEEFPPPANVTGTPPDTSHEPTPSAPPKPPKPSKTPKQKHTKNSTPTPPPAPPTTQAPPPPPPTTSTPPVSHSPSPTNTCGVFTCPPAGGGGGPGSGSSTGGAGGGPGAGATPRRIAGS
jgi:membrane peptidoglycan carboxypeptidase